MKNSEKSSFVVLQVKTQLEPLFVVQKSGSGTTETCQKMPIAMVA